MVKDLLNALHKQRQKEGQGERCTYTHKEHSNPTAVQFLKEGIPKEEPSIKENSESVPENPTYSIKQSPALIFILYLNESNFHIKATARWTRKASMNTFPLSPF